MVGQIALPAYEKEFGQGTEIIRPATLSPNPNRILFAKSLVLMGAISTDATQMIGFLSAMPYRTCCTDSNREWLRYLFV